MHNTVEMLRGWPILVAILASTSVLGLIISSIAALVDDDFTVAEHYVYGQSLSVLVLVSAVLTLVVMLFMDLWTWALG